jgi:TolB-like protein
VRRALDYMREQLDHPIATADLVHICGVPERTLHKHFLAFVGRPPLAHLRQMRLAAAREALLLPGSDATSVTEVAARLGFAHLGRFAADYRRCFGEPPSATLARARATAERTTMVAVSSPHVQLANDTSADERPHRPSLRRQAPLLVVLPFRTAVGTLEERILAEGLADRLTAALAQSSAVSVRMVSPAAVRSERAVLDLGALYCLTGRIARSPEGRVRVVAHLLDLAAGGTHLWGDAYDGAAADPFALQDRVAEGVAQAVRSGVQAAEIERARRKPDRDVGAHDLVLRALPLVLAADPASALQALGLLEEAMRLDPDDPAPTALAGWCRAQLVLYQATPDPAAERARTLRLAERAAALDPLGDPLVLTARSGITMLAGQREDAEALLGRAQAIDPSFAWAWERSAWVRANYGEPEAALAHFQRAIPLKGPRAPMANCLAGIGTAHFGAGRHAEAASWIRRALAENPGAVWLNRVLAPCYLALDEREAARASLDRLRRAYPAITVERIAAGLPRFCEGRARGADGPILGGLARLGLPA